MHDADRSAPTDTHTEAPVDLLTELAWRDLVFQCTDEGALREHLAAEPRRIYVGFDPTADSLTIGNLVPILALVHVARAGHEPIVLMGGGTGLIGDPSGKSAERQLMTDKQVAANVERQRGIFERVFANAGLPTPRIVNNLDWLSGLSYIELLRDVGKHFSVNMMMQKDSVRSRLEERDQGISYTEFSYMILQAYDFLHLHKAEGVSVQMGGSDQWGNIVAGTDLIRKASDRANQPAMGLTVPLVTKADGGKFGKTETGAIWLTGPSDGETSSQRTTAYAMHQFWLNTADADVGRFLRTFTLLDQDAIESIEAEHEAEPGRRIAQRALADAATALVHGADEAEAAERAGKALFSGDIADLPERTLMDVLADVPSSDHERSSLHGEGVDLIELLIETKLAKSKREAREFVANGSVSINGSKCPEGRRVTTGDLLHGRLIALRRGKKAWHLTRWG